MRTLLVAAGGGGDALGALLVRRLIAPADEPALIATYAWERLRIDPTPGPRGIAGFVGLAKVGDRRAEVIPASDTIPPGRSTLPRLTACTGMRLFVLDPSSGAVGMRQQLRSLTEELGVDRVIVLDVGGDAVATGDEPHLLSPLADALALAACADLTIPVNVAVAGPAVDGELDEETVLRNLRDVRARQCGVVGPDDVDTISGILAWHPSEATAVLAAAALGIRGMVEIRQHSIVIPLTDISATVWIAPFNAVSKHSLIVGALHAASSLEEVEDVVKRTTISELDRERKRAADLNIDTSGGVSSDAALRVLHYARKARDRGIDLITTRRLLEAIDLPSLDTATLRLALGLSIGTCMRGPLWDVSALAREIPQE